MRQPELLNELMILVVPLEKEIRMTSPVHAQCSCVLCRLSGFYRLPIPVRLELMRLVFVEKFEGSPKELMAEVSQRLAA